MSWFLKSLVVLIAGSISLTGLQGCTSGGRYR